MHAKQDMCLIRNKSELTMKITIDSANETIMSDNQAMQTKEMIKIWLFMHCSKTVAKGREEIYRRTKPLCPLCNQLWK